MKVKSVIGKSEWIYTKLKSKWILVWWVAVLFLAGLGIWASITLHPKNSAPSETDTNVAIPSHEISILPANYNPVHYLSFNGNNSYGVIPANQKLNVHQFSIAFWARSDGSNHSSFDRPINMLKWRKSPVGTMTPYGWAFETGDQIRMGNDKTRFIVGSTLEKIFVTNYASIPRDTWSFIVGIFDGTTVKLYQNGALAGESHFGGAYGYPVPPLPIRLAGGWTPNHYWPGDLSNIQMYDRALSPVEIGSIFRGHNISSGLIGWWRLTDGSGNSITDSSGNSNNGIIHNTMWK